MHDEGAAAGSRATADGEGEVLAPPQSRGRRKHGIARGRQAESSPRPLRRRAEMIARPARVRMRSRNPWVFARRRLLGWKVRLLTCGLQDGGSAAGFLGRTIPVTRSPYPRRGRPPARGGRTHDPSTVRNGAGRGQTAASRYGLRAVVGGVSGAVRCQSAGFPHRFSTGAYVAGEKDENRTEDRPHGPWATDTQPVDRRVDNGPMPR